MKKATSDEHVCRFPEWHRSASDAMPDPAEVTQACDEMRREHDSLDAQRCPKCGERLSKQLDRRQDGITSVAGSWYNYRCGCGYMCDRCEPSRGELQ